MIKTERAPHTASLFTAAKTLSVAFLLSSVLNTSAVSIISGPFLSSTINAPLAARLRIATDLDSRVSVAVTDGTVTWTKDFYDFSTNHDFPLLGFKPNQTNAVVVTVHAKDPHDSAQAAALAFNTGPLPSDFPTSVLLKQDAAKMEPGYTLFLISHTGLTTGRYITIVDNNAQVVWYAPWTPNDVDVRQLDNGNLFIEEQGAPGQFLELNMLGRTVRTLPAPSRYPVNAHEGLVTDHGSILYLSDQTRSVSNFPSSSTYSNPPVSTEKIDDNPVVEISSTDGSVLHEWSPLDLLDPTRVTYLTYSLTNPNGIDNEHANAIIEDPSDNSVIVSLRNQNAVFKISRATGGLKWILGPTAGWHTNFQQYLLTPIGSPFEWNYGQHGPSITSDGTLLLHDNGVDRASPFDPPVEDKANYSRAVEYSIDETNMTVTQVWDSTAAVEDRLYTPILGKAQWLPQRRNVLSTYGYITYINGVHPSAASPFATMVRIIEYTHDPIPEVVFDLSFFDYNNTDPSYPGYLCYRALRIPDLYGHPAQPVANLAQTTYGGLPLLTFSADPAHTYTVQTSNDLITWTTLGTAVQGETAGEFSFQDMDPAPSVARFYRVLTQ